MNISRNTSAIALVFICFLALAVRLAGIYLFSEMPRGDTFWYHQTAINFLETGQYVNSIDKFPTAFKLPGYTLLLAGIYHIFGASYAVAAVFNAIIGVACTYLIYVLAGYFLPNRLSLVCALAYSLWPSFLIVYVPKLFVETIYGLFILLILIRMVILFRETSFRNVMIFSILVGMSLYFRPALVLLPGALLIICVMNRVSLLKTFLFICSSVLIMLAILLPWVIRNYLVFDEFVILGTFGGYNFAVQVLEPTGYASSTAHYPPGASRDLPYVRYEFYWHEHGMRMWAEYVRSNFIDWLELRWKAVYFLWHQDLPRHFSSTLYSADSLYPAWVVVQTHYVIFMAVAFFGAITVLCKMIAGYMMGKLISASFLLVAILIYWQGFYLLLYGHPRYHMVMIPVIIILAGIGMNTGAHCARQLFRRLALRPDRVCGT